MIFGTTLMPASGDNRRMPAHAMRPSSTTSRIFHNGDGQKQHESSAISLADDINIHGGTYGMIFASLPMMRHAAEAPFDDEHMAGRHFCRFRR